MKRRVDPEPSTITTYGGCNTDDLDLMAALEHYTLHDMRSGAHYNKILEILQRGANPNTQPDIQGPTALIACANHTAEYFDLDVARLLIQCGANPTMKFYGCTAVGWLQSHNNMHGADALKAAINQHSDRWYNREEVECFHPNAKRSNNFRS